VWTATTIARIATTTAVAIIVKSGIAVDFADFAMSHPLISDEGESYSPEIGAARRTSKTRLFVSQFLLSAHVAYSGYLPFHRTVPAVTAKQPPAGPQWIHEIKHDGFRIMARRDAAGVRLISRNGSDFTARFPLAAAAVASLPARSFLIAGEAIVTDAKGLAVFDLIRRQRHSSDAVLISFDLIELEGEDLRGSPIEYRKGKLAKLVRGPHPGIVLNEFFEGDGDILFEHACKLGCEGIVSKRLGSRYRSGRSPHWRSRIRPRLR
jgi:bifunctional non-homologous end joining protein LigD